MKQRVNVTTMKQVIGLPKSKEKLNKLPTVQYFPKERNFQRT